jgi:hypothetical protein
MTDDDGDDGDDDDNDSTSEFTRISPDWKTLSN